MQLQYKVRLIHYDRWFDSTKCILGGTFGIHSQTQYTAIFFGHHNIQLWYLHFVFEVLVNCERFRTTKPVNHKYDFDLQFEDLEVMTLRPPCPSTIANLVTRIKKGNGVKNNCLDYELPFISGCFVNRAVRANSASLEFASSSTN